MADKVIDNIFVESPSVPFPHQVCVQNLIGRETIIGVFIEQFFVNARQHSRLPQQVGAVWRSTNNTFSILRDCCLSGLSRPSHIQQPVRL